MQKNKYERAIFADVKYKKMTLSFDEIKVKALELGWDDVGITPANIRQEDIQAYKEWLAEGKHADLAYMEKEIRCYPQQYFPQAKTALIFLSYYKQPKEDLLTGQGLIASYARGRDYHHLHRKRLKKFIQWLEERAGAQGIAKGFSDSSPLLEKALAVQAGLGWFGKNTLLIHRRFGTYTLLSGILTSLEIPGAVISLRLPRCGSCTRCIDACPTQALTSPYKLDAARCLSYHLIESKKPIPLEIQQKNPGYIFGCDICQEACPHNQRTLPSLTAAFSPASGNGIYLDLKKIEECEKNPEKLFGTPLQRRGITGLKYTAETLKLK
ncbi:Epoxyqueuosine reductase|nr:Epoxyqueuosine reductase [Neochlamydia sp. AcF84]